MEGDYDKRIEEFKSKLKSFPDFPHKGILFWDIFSALADGPTCTLLQGILADTVRTKFPGIDAVVGLESRGFLFAFSLAAELGVSCLPVRKKGKLPGEVMSYKYDLEYGSAPCRTLQVSMQKCITTMGMREETPDKLHVCIDSDCYSEVDHNQKPIQIIGSLYVYITHSVVAADQEHPTMKDVLEIQKASVRPGLKCLIVDDLIATGGSLSAAIHLLKSNGADVVGCLVIMELESLNGRSHIPSGIAVHSLVKYD